MTYYVSDAAGGSWVEYHVGRDPPIVAATCDKLALDQTPLVGRRLIVANEAVERRVVAAASGTVAVAASAIAGR